MSDSDLTSNWTNEDSKQMRQRLARLSHSDLRQVYAAVQYLCSGNAGCVTSIERYIVQRELVRDETPATWITLIGR